jgi:predicted aspartyl protease
MRLHARLLLATCLGAVAVPLLLADEPSSSAANLIKLQLADLLMAEGRYHEALDAYEEAKDPDDPATNLRAWGGIVLGALRTAQFDRALTEGMKLRAAVPGDGEALAIFGEAQWAASLFEEAEQTFREAISIDPNAARAHNGLARALAARSDLTGALEEARMAIELAPREGDFHHTLGFIQERMHNFEDAAASLVNYVNLLPNKDNSDRAAWSRAEIRFLRSFGRRVPFQLEDDSEDKLHTVSFRLERDKVIVKGSINGGQVTDLVLDTGAEQTVIGRRTARLAGVTPIVYTLSAGVGDIGLRGLQVGRIDSLQIGSLKISNVPCLIKNPELGGLPTREADSFSPLALGMSMTIDYERRLLTIGRKVPMEDADTELPMRLHRLAMVRGTVNQGGPVHFVVDTGGEVISISQATASSLPPTATRRIPLRVYGNSGWDRDAFLMPGVDLDFDTIRFRNFPVVVLNLEAPSALLGFRLGGIVGHRFLSRYRVSIDLERSVLRLKKL